MKGDEKINSKSTSVWHPSLCYPWPKSRASSPQQLHKLSLLHPPSISLPPPSPIFKTSSVKPNNNNNNQVHQYTNLNQIKLKNKPKLNPTTQITRLKKKKNLFLPRSCVEQVQHLRIGFHLIPVHHLLLTKLRQRDQSFTKVTHKPTSP